MRRVRMLFFVEEREFVLLHHIRMPLSELAAPVLSLFGVLWVFDVACPPTGLNAPPVAQNLSFLVFPFVERASERMVSGEVKRAVMNKFTCVQTHSTHLHCTSPILMYFFFPAVLSFRHRVLVM